MSIRNVIYDIYCIYVLLKSNATLVITMDIHKVQVSLDTIHPVCLFPEGKSLEEKRLSVSCLSLAWQWIKCPLRL